MIRSRYYDLLTGRMTPADFQFVTGLGGDGVDVPTTSELNHGAQHIDHCFDYLQSGIRCAGQMDLEYAVQRGTSGFLAGEHQCRSWVSDIIPFYYHCLRCQLKARSGTSRLQVDGIEC